VINEDGLLSKKYMSLMKRMSCCPPGNCPVWRGLVAVDRKQFSLKRMKSWPTGQLPKRRVAAAGQKDIVPTEEDELLATRTLFSLKRLNCWSTGQFPD
jgi:hypothetical protein